MRDDNEAVMGQAVGRIDVKVMVNLIVAVFFWIK
jgi:hypothetical protein